MLIVQDTLSSILQGLSEFSVLTVQVGNVIEANSSASFTTGYRRGWYLPWHRLVRIRQAHYVLYSAFILTINIWSWKVSSSGSTAVVLNWERFLSPSGTLGNVLSPSWRGAYPWHVLCRSQGCWKSSLHAQEPLWPPTENYPVQSVKFQGLENLHISSIFFLNLFMAALGLCWCSDFSLVAASRLQGAWASKVASEGSVVGVCGLWSVGLTVTVHRLCCSVVCGIFLGQGWNPCFLYWQVASLPLSHQVSPAYFIFNAS